MNKQTDKQTLATGADLTPAMFEDFRQRLVHHCRGEGVRDHCTADAIFIVRARQLVYGFGPDYIDNRVVIHEDRKHFSPQEYWDDLNEEERPELNKRLKQNLNVKLTQAQLDLRKGDTAWCQSCLKRRVNKGYSRCFYCS